jgi:hypothetical protein
MEHRTLIMRDERAGRSVGLTTAKGRSGHLPESRNSAAGNRERNAVSIPSCREMAGAALMLLPYLGSIDSALQDTQHFPQ